MTGKNDFIEIELLNHTRYFGDNLKPSRLDRRTTELTWFKVPSNVYNRILKCRNPALTWLLLCYIVDLTRAQLCSKSVLSLYKLRQSLNTRQSSLIEALDELKRCSLARWERAPEQNRTEQIREEKENFILKNVDNSVTQDSDEGYDTWQKDGASIKQMVDEVFTQLGAKRV